MTPDNKFLWRRLSGGGLTRNQPKQVYRCFFDLVETWSTIFMQKFIDDYVKINVKRCCQKQILGPKTIKFFRRSFFVWKPIICDANFANFYLKFVGYFFWRLTFCSSNFSCLRIYDSQH